MSDADLSTVYRFGDGGLSPLTGPMNEATWNRVLSEGAIEHGGKRWAWTIPLALPVTRELAGKLGPGTKAALVNSRGDVHGGTLMATLDFTLSGAARSHAPTETGVITIDMSTHFLAAARGELTLEARCLRRGARIAFCEGEVKDAAGTVVCVARAAFKLVPLSSGGN